MNTKRSVISWIYKYLHTVVPYLHSCDRKSNSLYNPNIRQQTNFFAFVLWGAGSSSSSLSSAAVAVAARVLIIKRVKRSSHIFGRLSILYHSLVKYDYRTIPYHTVGLVPFPRPWARPFSSWLTPAHHQQSAYVGVPVQSRLFCTFRRLSVGTHSLLDALRTLRLNWYRRVGQTLCVRVSIWCMVDNLLKNSNTVI